MRKTYGPRARNDGPAMAGLLPSRRAATSRVFWPRGLRRAAFLLAAGVGLFWFSVASGRWSIPIPESGPIYGDLLIAWVAVLVHVSAWPNLWAGLRDLRAREPNEAGVLVAWRAFLLTVAVVVAAIAVLLFEYRAIVSPDAWIFILYVTVFRYVGWSFVPILALQGVLFGRVAGYLEPRFRYLADVGAFVLFAVAAATTGVVLQSPGATAFAQAWSLGSGILLGAALVGYVLIALGMTAHLASATLRLPLWPRQRPRGSSTERSLQVFR